MRYLILIFVLLSASAHAKSDDIYDVRFNALGFVFGAVVLDLNIAIAPNWTLGPQLGMAHARAGKDAGFTDDYDLKSYSAGIRGNWFLNGNYTDGFYVGPSLKWAEVKVKTADSVGPITESKNETVLACLLGYGWFWESFNVMLGGGLAVGLGDTQLKVTNSSGQTATVSSGVSSITTEVALGWTF